jgi:Trypsin
MRISGQARAVRGVFLRTPTAVVITRQRCAVWACMSLAVLCCPSAAWSMTGGLPQNPAPGWSARIDYPGHWCSGELIAPTWVITAGHCVLHKSASGYMVHIRGATISATHIFAAPGYTAETVRYPDVGLIQLSVNAVQAHGASTLPLATQADVSYFVNRGVTVFGYGREADGHSPTIVNKSRDGAWIGDASYCPAEHDVCFRLAEWAQGVTNITEGDSGGAWVGWRNGGWQLLAVVSGFPELHEFPYLQAATSPASPDIAAWIASHVAPPSQTPGGSGSGSQTPAPGPSGPSSPPASPPPSAPTYAETTGSVAHTWTDYTNAGGNEGPEIASNQTVEIACWVSGFAVADGNTYWYQIASSPWNDAYYVSADAFYNNSETSGTLIGTPWVDPAVPNCSNTSGGGGGGSKSGFAETPGPGGVATFTDYQDAGGTEGPRISQYETVQVTCRIEGFEPADHGIPDNWWYLIASSPWNDAYYAYAEPFYNDGQTSGSLIGTPAVNTSVPIC